MTIAETALVAVLACAPFERTDWRGERRVSIRCETERAIVDFDLEGLEDGERDAFVRLADRGVVDLERLVASILEPPARRERIRFIVSRRVGMSRTYGRTVLLPLERVRDRRAPYLHETVHALVRTPHRSAWLTEGLACYLESWVAENVGGYDAHVFSRAGDRGIHDTARRYLQTETGRAVLPWVGTSGEPPSLFQDRAGVARPFYVLAHSFTKFLVERLGLGVVVHLVTQPDPEASLEDLSGRASAEWRAEWLRGRGLAYLASPPGLPPPPTGASGE